MNAKHRPTEGLNHEFGFSTTTGAIPSIQVNVARSLTDGQYLEALKRLRKIIESRKMKAIDSTAPGDKYTECSWGLCSEAKDLWPTPELHVWPYDFLNEGRVAPLSLGEKLCPMDTRDKSDGQGCFYTCRVFQRRHKTPSREDALKLVDAAIAKATGKESA